ncbi:MAG TPA: hypothetical protein VII69_14715 [Candidatus Eremiobacteraceae bacterium]
MATNLTVESTDKSSRWYITPGTSSTYDLQVHNDTDRAVLCRVTLDSHPDTGSVKPQSLTLQARETRNVSVTFGPDARLPRDRKAVITIKDAAGQALSTVERELVSGSSTDATLVLAWKEPIVENDKLCGFVLLCTIRSLSGGADDFTPEFAPHPSLRFPELAPVPIEAGATANFEVPIRWQRAARDAEGWNHPRAIEASVAVSQGRRSGRLSWDVVQRTIGEMLDRSDRSPVVERKAAAPSFVPTSHPTNGSDVETNGVVPASSDVVKPVSPVAPAAAGSEIVAQPTAATPSTQVPTPPSHTEPPKKAHNIDSDLAIDFSGYRPAFQLVNGKGAAPPVPPLVGELIAGPPNAAIKVDDLDASIVGSGLAYARYANGATPAAPSSQKRVPAAAWVAGIVVLVVAAFMLFRPHDSAVQSAPSNVAVSAPAAVAVSVPAVTSPARAARTYHAVVRVAPKPKVVVPSPAATVKTRAATIAPTVTAAPAPAPVVAAVHRTPARPIAVRPAPINRSALPEIASVDASYATKGRFVRVAWDSTSQASATIQLTDARGTLIAQSAVNGGRSRVLLGLPRGFHGGVYIQVSVTGYHSERVVQTSSLPPF